MIYNPPTASFADYYLRPFEAAGPASGVQASARRTRPVERDAQTIPEGHRDVSLHPAISSVRFRASGGRILIDDALPQRPDHILHDQRVLPAVR
jgi:hypothetical protein